MDTVIKIGLFAVAWIAGAVLGSFMIGNLVLSTSYGIPLSIRLKNKGLLANNGVMIRYAVTFLVNSMLICLTVVGVAWFVPQLLMGFLFGLGLVIFRLGSDNVRYSTDNLADYVEANAQSFTRDPRELSEDEMNEYFDLRQTDDIEGNQLFARVCGELVSNTLFSGVLTVGVLIAGSFSWWVGIVLAGALAIFTVLSALQTLFLVVMAPIGVLLPLFSRERNERDSYGRVMWKENLWMAFAAVPRLIELAIDVAYMLVLYGFFFPGEVGK